MESSGIFPYRFFVPDVFTKARRSAVMSRIRSAGNKDTELRLIAIFRTQGITGWRRSVTLRVPGGEAHAKTPRRKAALSDRKTETMAWRLRALARGESLRRFSVRPDFVFRALKLAVFVDGCFWHGCPRHGTQPKGNAAFWRRKLAANRARDRLVNRTLRAHGWRVLRIWEHELTRRNEPRCRARLRRALAASGCRGK
jgi:DNA mismatch endonuclease, patch repair protein